MTLSERVYRVLLVAYPLKHRRRYGEPMALLFRDRLRRDGGGLGTMGLWGHVGFDLARSAFTERMEITMTMETWTSRWWEGTVVALAVNSVVFGVLFTMNDYPGWAFRVGFVPAALLITGLLLRRKWRIGATAMVIVGSLLAALAFWVIYTIVLALLIIVGGLAKGKIGPVRVQHQPA